MDSVVVYHNPSCSKSRGALEILHEQGVDADVVEYLKAPPDRATLERIVDAIPNPPGDLVRKDKRFKELGLDAGEYTTRAAVVKLLLAHPELMERPVVFRGKRAVIARPSEAVLELLPVNVEGDPMAVITAETVRDEVRAWLAESWDPEITVAEWWERLMRSGYGAPTWPEEDFGRGYNRALANVVNEEIAQAGAIGPPAGLGYLLAGPTIVKHGSREQKDLWLTRILNGQDAWCQLFSEPGAGSDLAGLQCKADRDGDEWIITGQKVWTSTAQICNLGMLIARTDPEAPKHTGISYFAFDMGQPGVEIRPLREMTGRAMFNEVFIDGARVPDWNMIGGLNNGWAVANTTLAAERAGLGSGGTGGAGSAFPGPLAGHLDKPVGEQVGQVRTGGTGGGGGGMAQHLIKLARDTGRDSDPSVRQNLARLYSLQQIGKYSSLRARAGNASAGAPNMAKLMMSDMLRLNREVGTQILGAETMLMGKDAAHGGGVQEMILFSPGPSIYGGTDQVQRNILGERVLGLPKEPDPNKGAPFKDVPKNA